MTLWVASSTKKGLFFDYIPFLPPVQVKDGLVLPDKASLYLTAIEDADYKDEKIECEIDRFHIVYLMDIRFCI